MLTALRQARLPQIAGSLSFTTVLSIVPLFSVAFALFTYLPVFKRFESAIEEHLLQSMLPADISRTVLGQLHLFAANANRLTWVGSVFLLAVAVAMLLTVENALNQIWNVKRSRPFMRRVAMYVLMLAFGPMALGASLWATSYLVGMSAGLTDALPPSARFMLHLGPLLLGVAALACLFRYVPSANVGWGEALVGGLVGGIAFELGKRAFAAYVFKLPTYKAMYGGFAVFPVFLLWIYVSWLVTLAAALVTARLGKARLLKVRA